MGRPRKNPDEPKKKCNYCHETKPLTDFYSSVSPINSADGRVPICKDCVFGAALKRDGSIDYIEFNKVLKVIDKPYYKDFLDSAINSFKKEYPFIEDDEVKYHGKQILGRYFSIIATKSYKNKTYQDSMDDGFVSKGARMDGTDISVIANKYQDINSLNSDSESYLLNRHYAPPSDFEVTDEIRNLFGDGYTTIEYRNMWEKYERLKQNYTLQTSIHQEALATYVRFKVKEEMATAAGNVDEARKWYESAQNAADKAKLTPKQLTQADLHNGISSFSEIFKAVEQAVDIIPILPSFKYRPNDSADFIIWCYINYARELQGLPQCSYKDVYEFYDRKKAEYISQYGDPYGIFKDDPTEEVRPNIEKFVELPDDYYGGDSE